MIHDIDFATVIEQSYYLLITFLKLDWIVDAEHLDNLIITIGYWHESCQD